MDFNSFKADLLQEGATGISLVKVKDIEIRGEFRAICDANGCGKYGTNWCCPPACGSFTETKEKMGKYRDALVIQRVSPLEDSFDFEGMMQAQKDFSKLMIKAVNLAKTKFGLTDFLSLGAGGCTICPECTYPTEPCRYPGLIMPSIEAYGIDALALSRLANLPYGNKNAGTPSVYYFGVILF